MTDLTELGRCARLVLVAAAAIAATPTALRADPVPLYKNANAPVEARVEDLLSRMTLDEKVAQLLTVDGGARINRARARELYPDGVGDFTRPSDWAAPPTGGQPPPVRTLEESLAAMNEIQHWAVEDTRLGIPVVFHEEGLHGATISGATSFPQAISMASSWDPALVTRINAVIARELRARGVTAVLSPVVDVVRDPRWGRIEETFGEDPYLVGEMGVAAVRGLQGETIPLAPDKVFATLKHFTGHGWPENGTNVGPAPYGERTLREVFFPPFEEVIRRTTVRRVMASYNEIEGIPSHANRWLLTDVLRGEWGFSGAVVGDYFAIRQLNDQHHVAADLPQAAAMALHAGVDLDEPSGEAFKFLADEVRAGRVPLSEIDAAVRRLLRIKFETGLFEHPFTQSEGADALIDNAEARALAVEAAQRTAVLLKNDNNLLPFDIANIRTLAVIGHNAQAAHIGNYSGRPRHTVSLLDGVRAYVGDRARVVYAEGVRVTKSDAPWGPVELADPAENARLIREAVAAARRADHIILVLGDPEQTSREAWLPNHLGDRMDLDLLGQQNDLFDAIMALHKPTAVVLINGRPPSYPHVADNAQAILETWYAGQEQGTAIAQLLFGEANPGGKMPLSVARTVGQLPIYYDRKPQARRGYLFGDTEPLYPFGYGLSYTNFSLSAPRLSANTIRPDGSVQVAVDVRNTGSRAGDEVVQLYVHDQVSSVTRPIKQLRAFERVTLAPGEGRTVTFTLTSEAFAFYNAAMRRVVEPGAFDIMVGPNSRDLQTAVLTISNARS